MKQEKAPSKVTTAGHPFDGIDPEGAMAPSQTEPMLSRGYKRENGRWVPA